jgi:HlyD family secretion protein
MVDIQRPPSALRAKKIRRATYLAAAVIAIVGISIAVVRLEPAAPTVERATVWIDTVKRGSMLRQVRGSGTLVPEDTRWIPALTEGRVERIILRPGAVVTPDDVILELSNPQLEQLALEAQLQLQAAEAAHTNRRVELDNQLLAQRAAVATVEAERRQAQLQAEADQTLAKDGLVSDLTV